MPALPRLPLSLLAPTPRVLAGAVRHVHRRVWKGPEVERVPEGEPVGGRPVGGRPAEGGQVGDGAAEDVQAPQVEHVLIEARGIEEPGAKDLRRSLQRAVEQLDRVEWAEVNALTRRVAVGFQGGEEALGELLGVVQDVEARAGARRRAVDDGFEHPSDLEPIQRRVLALTGDVLGLGIATVGRVARLPRIPIEVASLLSLVDNQPHLRGGLEKVLGRQPTEVLLRLLQAAANGAAQGPAGLLNDIGLQTTLLLELLSRREVWERREPELYSSPRARTIAPPKVDPRPVPLPDGPVEQWSDRLALGGLAGFAATLSATADARRSADAFLAATPRAARYSREAFAAQLGRTLAARGVVPLDSEALRRLDRLDTVVIDSVVLVCDRPEVIEAHGFGDRPAMEVAELARGTLRRQRDGGHADGGDGEEAGTADAPTVELESFRALRESERPLPRGARTRAKELGRGGVDVFGVIVEGELAGLAGLARELDPSAARLVEAVRRAGHRLVVAGRRGGAARQVDADLSVPRGRKLADAVRQLQADGAVVAVIGKRGKSALAAADIGIALTRASGRPQWSADLVTGRDLSDAAFIIDASVIAAEASRRGAQLALLGSGVGAMLAMSGPRAAAGRRSQTAVNGAAAVGLATGTWSGLQLARRPQPALPPSTPWHELDVDDVLEELDASEEGLSEATVAARRRFDERADSDLGRLEPFIDELANPITPIIAAGAAVSAAVGSMTDAAMIGGLIGVNTVVGGLQRLRTERSLKELSSQGVLLARVRREGREQQIPARDLVPGDVVICEAGDVVPADCRLLAGEAVEVDESAVTGESQPVTKSVEPTPGAVVAERTGMLYEGTTVAAGRAVGVVVATGRFTEAGRGVAEAAGALAPRSGVEERLADLTDRVLPLSLVSGAAVAGAGVLRRWPPRELVTSAVGLAVASVPEGLPFVSTAAQTAAARRLAERGALVRNPRAVEALGRVDLLCFDKTGTLTEGRITVRRVGDGRRDAALEELDPELRAVLAAALRATPHEDGGAANSTDQAVLAGSETIGMKAVEGLHEWHFVSALPFEPGRGLHAVLGACADGHRLSVKGAPEAVLPACDTWHGAPFDEDARKELDAEVERLAAEGHRILAVAERTASQRTELDDERVERLNLCGLLALADPVRPAAAEAVRDLRRAGVDVAMITGDHPSTARAIASELGILDDRRVLSGAELNVMDEGDLAEVLPEIAVFARVTPAQKVRIVRAAQQAGRTVAMTGDGANDAPSIRLADVGVALGGRGTPAATEAADVVVTDDRIETLIHAIVEGRAMWRSVRDALAILVGGNLGEIGYTVVTSLGSRRPVTNARQFLLVNLLTDLAPSTAIAVRPPQVGEPERLLREGPDRSLGAALRREITIRAGATALAGSGAWWAARFTGSRPRASTVGLVGLVGAQLGQTLVAGGGRPAVVVTSVGSAAVLAAAVQTPGVSHFFGCRPLGPVGWTIAASAATAGTLGAVVADRLVPPANGMNGNGSVSGSAS